MLDSEEFSTNYDQYNKVDRTFLQLLIDKKDMEATEIVISSSTETI